MTKTELKEHIRKVVRECLNESNPWRDEAAGRGIGGGSWRDNYPRGGDDEYPQCRIFCVSFWIKEYGGKFGLLSYKECSFIAKEKAMTELDSGCSGWLPSFTFEQICERLGVECP